MVKDLEQQIVAYIQAFNHHDAVAMAALMRDDVELTDWDNSASGKASVTAVNASIFAAVPDISATLSSLIGPTLSPRGEGWVDACAVLEITIPQPEASAITLPVVDILTFDADLLIASIRAYKG